MISVLNESSQGDDIVFGDKKDADKRRGASFHESAVTILTPGCHFDGRLYCRGSSRIGGKVEGQIISEGLLIIEEDAVITASIVADEAVIQGSLSGKLEAKGRVELTCTSRVEGDIITPSLIISEGARFNGHTSMKPAEATANNHAPVVGKIDKRALSKNKNSSSIPIPEIGAQT